MKLNCLLAGVGGQGTVLASKILAQSAIDEGCMARTSETIGMAQRGGCVVSHVKIGDDLFSPSIAAGSADLLIGFEPAEAVRNLSFLKPDGCAVVSAKAIKPVTSSLSGDAYTADSMLDYLHGAVSRLVVVDTEALCAQVGNAKTLNIILLGAALGAGLLPFSKQSILRTIQGHLPEKIWAVNRLALEAGIASQGPNIPDSL